MEGSCNEADDTLKCPSSSSPVVAVAIKGNKKSKAVMKWALDKFIPEGRINFKLLHVRDGITGIPTPRNIPITQVREEVAVAYMREMDWKTNEMLIPFKKMCAQRKVQVEVIVIESEDVATAIAEEVAKISVTKLVVGVSSHSIFGRKMKGLSARISVCTPRFCTVYAVSKGKLSSLRPSDVRIDQSIKDDDSESSCSNSSSSNCTSISQTDSSSISSLAPSQLPSLPTQRLHALSAINNTLLNTKELLPEIDYSRCQSIVIGNDYITSCSSTGDSDTQHALSRVSSCRSTPTNKLWISSHSSMQNASTEYPLSNNQETINLELEKLRTELKRANVMISKVQDENLDVSQKLKDLSQWRLEEARKLKEVTAKEEVARELATKEKERSQSAVRQAAYLKECAEREAAERKLVETKALNAAKENKKLEDALVGAESHYQVFTWEEIITATSSFSEDLMIGAGAYGTVYRCSLYHSTLAVKVLHSMESHRSKQFQKELEILSRIHHPHLLLLFGACPDRGCLVYEFMENGSLEDRLLRKNNTLPIPWFERYRIAWEVASALAFLHNSKPTPIIHRDLKPANILLDHNLVSKIGDVGLATMLFSDSTLPSIYKDTAPVGTLCYIDPEYQRTGLVSPKSDIYAFGIVILQLLTGKEAIALAHLVETAMDDGNLKDILDPTAGDWPIEETFELTKLGLSCAELRRRDRPDLDGQVLPALERLKKAADKSRRSSTSFIHKAPNHFICPVLKDVMNDPCVAADGFTYDRKAIERWLEENHNSPMTNMPLPNKNLVPNYTLLSAILEWKAERNYVLL